MWPFICSVIAPISYITYPFRVALLFSSPEHKVLRVSYCERPLSVVRRRPSFVVRQPFYLNIFFSKPLIGFWPNFTGMISTKFTGKIGFPNAIFKNLLVWKYKAQRFHIWYTASSRSPLLKLFKLCPWGQIWPRPGGHNFTLNYIRKSSNDISWTANGNLTKLNRNCPSVVPYQNCSNGFDWLH